MNANKSALKYTAMGWYNKLEHPGPEDLVFATLVDDNDLRCTFRGRSEIPTVHGTPVNYTVTAKQDLGITDLLRWAQVLDGARVIVEPEPDQSNVVYVRIIGGLPTTKYAVAVCAKYFDEDQDKVLRAVGMTIADKPQVVSVDVLRRVT